MKQINQHLMNKLEEAKELEFIDLVQDKRLLTEFIDSNIEANIEDIANIETFLEFFAYSREISRRAKAAARNRGE